jgi:hypothetical protein
LDGNQISVSEFIFEEEDVSLLPRVIGLDNLQSSLDYFVNSLNETFGETIFGENVSTSELTHLSGEKTLFLSGDNSTYNVLTTRSEGEVFIEGGNHNFLQADGDIKLNQSDGDVLFYLDNVQSINTSVDISQGNLTFIVNDSNLGFENFTMKNDNLFIGDTATGISIVSDDKGPINISIQNLITGQVWEHNNEYEPLENLDSRDSQDTISNEINSDIEIITSDETVLFNGGDDDMIFEDDFAIEFETLIQPDFDVSNPGPSLPASFSLSDYFSESLELLTSDIDKIMEISPEFEKSNNEASLEQALSVDDLISIADYTSLEWSSAVEIIEEL